MRILPWAACGLLLFTGCLGGGDDPQYALLEPQPGTLGIGAIQQLEATRQPGAAPPTVYGHLELSDYAVERFDSLEALVTVSSAEPFTSDGLRADWIGEPGGLPIVGQFENGLSTIWSANLAPAACTELPCVVSFALTSAPASNSALRFDTESMTYELRAWLRVRGQYRSEYEELDSALAISLQEAP